MRSGKNVWVKGENADMGYVYKYTDLSDGIVKYIGVVLRECKNGLSKRIYEHSQRDLWVFNKKWKIEYLETKTNNDAYALEGHFISRYKTYEWYNVKKADWGVLSFLDENKLSWKVYLENVSYTEKEIKSYVPDFKVKEVFELKKLLEKRMSEVSEALNAIEEIMQLKDFDRMRMKIVIDDKRELLEEKEKLEKMWEDTFGIVCKKLWIGV